MSDEVFGRTNEPSPRIWLKPTAAPGSAFRDLAGSVSQFSTVVDISSNPALFGPLIPDELPLSVVLPDRPTRAIDEPQAYDFIQSEIIQALVSAQRQRIDFVFLTVRSAWEEFQAAGALGAMNEAKQDGLIRFVGLRAVGNPLAVLGFWQFHDAFEVVSFPWYEGQDEFAKVLVPMADDRRVGVIATDPFGLGVSAEDASASSEVLRQRLELSRAAVPITSPDTLAAWHQAGLLPSRARLAVGPQ